MAAMRTKQKYGVYMDVRLSEANERPLCVVCGQSESSTRWAAVGRLRSFILLKFTSDERLLSAQERHIALWNSDRQLTARISHNARQRDLIPHSEISDDGIALAHGQVFSGCIRVQTGACFDN